VLDNEFVHKGDLLLVIDPTDYKVAVQLSEAAVRQAQADAENVEAQIAVRQAQVGASQAQVESAQAALTFAQQQAARYRDLAEKEVGTVQMEQQTASNLAGASGSEECTGEPDTRSAPNRVAEGPARRGGGECCPRQRPAPSGAGQFGPHPNPCAGEWMVTNLRCSWVTTLRSAEAFSPLSMPIHSGSMPISKRRNSPPFARATLPRSN
jgi:hypothetical protein